MLTDRIDGFIRCSGKLLCWVNALLLAVTVLQVTLRYGFGMGLVVLEELQWHLYAIVMMYGLAYTHHTDSDVRVDIFYRCWSDKSRAIWDSIGIFCFLMPFCWVVLINSLEFVEDSWRVNERSSAPTGLPWRWLIKSVIPASILLLLIAALSRLVTNIRVITRLNNQ